MLSINVDEKQLDSIIREELQTRLKRLEHRHTFWDMNELVKQTNMSEPFIKEQFFYDDRFPKFKIGRKWLFPAKESEEFLLLWIKEKGRSHNEKCT